MKRRAFTLLETVIALAIGALVMGAAVTASRAVQNSVRVSNQRASIESIIDDTVLTINMFQNEARYYHVSLRDALPQLQVKGQVFRVIPYRLRGTGQGNLAPTDKTYLNLCADGLARCSGLISPVGPKVNDGQYSMPTALSANGAEVIAVRRAPATLNQPQVYDFTYLPPTGANTTILFGDRESDYTNWDFYRRQITIVYPNAPVNNAIFYYYLVKITVWPMTAGVNRPADAVTRTILISDY